MAEPDIDKMTRDLAAVIEKERREAIAYSLLTVLCTPVFVALASLAVGLVLLLIMGHLNYMADAFTIYTGLICFLGSMVGFVLLNSRDAPTDLQFDKTWLAAAGVFVLLLVVTYATPLQDRSPVFFATLFAVAGLVILGLLGQVPPGDRALRGSGGEQDLGIGIMALCGFIVGAYGELLSASWLWVPPKPDEVRIAARVLHHLAANRNEPLSHSTAGARVTTLLSRLKLVETTQERLTLTLKGQNFIQGIAPT